MAFIPGTPEEESRNYLGLDSRDFGNSQLLAQTSDWDEVPSKLVALLKSFPTMCLILSAHTGIGSIPDFSWSGVKLLVWLPALLLPITCAANVQMAHARPFSTSTLQGLSNSIKNTSRQGVFAFCCRALKLRESRRTPNSHFWECEFHPHTCLKVGLRQVRCKEDYRLLDIF